MTEEHLGAQQVERNDAIVTSRTRGGVGDLPLKGGADSLGSSFKHLGLPAGHEDRVASEIEVDAELLLLVAGRPREEVQEGSPVDDEVDVVEVELGVHVVDGDDERGQRRRAEAVSRLVVVDGVRLFRGLPRSFTGDEDGRVSCEHAA